MNLSDSGSLDAIFSFYNHLKIINISFQLNQLKCIICSCMKKFFFTQIIFHFGCYSIKQCSRIARLMIFFLQLQDLEFLFFKF